MAAYEEYRAKGSASVVAGRADLGGDSKLKFEEGVDSYVPYAGCAARQRKHSLC